MYDFDNIAKIFITETYLTYFLNERELPTLSFKFIEKEANDYIYNVIENEYIKISQEIGKMVNSINYDYDMIKEAENKRHNYRDILDALKKDDKKIFNYDYPIIIVKNYKDFFKYISDIMSNYLKKFNNGCYYNDSDILYTHTIDMLEYIWLRMTADDFNNVESFLKKQAEMLNNSYLDEYNVIKEIECDFLGDYVVSAHNKLTKFFNEESKEMDFYVSSLRFNEKRRIELPRVRYGIYEKNNKTICEIGSIQGFEDENNPKIEKLKYKLNSDTPSELIKNIEPKKLLSLLLFLKIIKENNINYISVPSIYILDYDYHEKRDKIYKSQWIPGVVNDENIYSGMLKEYNKIIDKQDIISENKTTNFVKLFERILYYFPDSKVLEYPLELSSYFNILMDYNNISSEQVRRVVK